MNIPTHMEAMVLEKAGMPLRLMQVAVPTPSKGQVLAKVMACGVCRTDLHIVDGELTNPALPLIPGHEIIAQVVETGDDVMARRNGDMIGIPWLGYTCGQCSFCREGLENLCENALFTGYTLQGGYAEYVVADERFCFPLTDKYANAGAAPLLCAGLIGYRSYSMIGQHVRNLGLYGFGAAAHILVQVAVSEGKKVFAFTRKDDHKGQAFAVSSGAIWAGDSTQSPPEKLDAAILFAPAGHLVPKALQDTRKGGVIVCAGIHMSDIPSFPYNLLWGERVIRSVANLTRKDGEAFMQLLSTVQIKTQTQIYPLENANTALDDLRNGRINGAAVLLMSHKKDLV